MDSFQIQNFLKEDLFASYQEIITQEDLIEAMCPHGDRSATNEMSREAFVMTNIIPQSPGINRKIWNQLETYCQSLARKVKALL